ncbi:MAG: hypothetical protein AYK18_05955 [Theionarchaea archaeon DG-70]|nr:MAG: hypothetical protein AYK18_05955 [Theionarchaea archaeon DG-70]
MVVGAFLFTVNPRMPYWLWAAFIGASLGIILTVCEPGKSDQEYSLKTYVTDMRKSISFIFHSKQLLWISFFFFIADIFAESYWDVFSQAHLKLTGLDPSVFGIIFAVCAGVNAVGSYYVDNVEKMLGEKRSLYVIIVVEVVVFGVMAYCSNGFGLIFLLIIFSTNRRFAWLLREYYSNRHIPSEKRAGILSGISFLYNGLFGGAVVIWLFGFSVDILGGRTTLVISSLFVLAMGFFLLQMRYKSY